MDDKKSSKASVAQSLVAKCHLRGSVPSSSRTYTVSSSSGLKIHFQMCMFTYDTSAIVDVGKNLEISSCQSIRSQNWPTWENWGAVRSPYYPALMNLSNLINPARVLYVYTTYTCSYVFVYVYVYTYMNLSNMINTVCVQSYTAYPEILWLFGWIFGLNLWL